MKTLNKFRKFVDEINKENSRNYKISILEKYKKDTDIQYYLNFIFNPFVITGISDKKLNRHVETDYTIQLNTIIDILNYAKDNNTGKDKDLSIIFTNRDTLFEDFDFNEFVDDNIQTEQDFQDMIASLYDLFDKVLIKNLQIGIDVKTINKVIPNLIPTFNVQLAEKYFEKPDYVEGKEFAITTKIDGGRIIAIKKNGNVKFYTRSGQLYEGLIDLETEMSLYMPDNIVLDGEITLLNDYEVLYDLKTGEPCVGHKLTSKERYKETMKITRKDGEKHGVKMLVFDAMTVTEFENQQCYRYYKETRAYLDQLFTNNWAAITQDGDKITCPCFTYFELLPILYQGKDTSKIIEFLDEEIAKGEEGVMINICDAPYAFKRTWTLLKVKKFNSCDLRVVALECGTNKNSDKLGAFICEYKNNNTVKVGSGISEEQRIEVWNNQDKYIGSIIEVSYFEETKNQNGGMSLRFPTFKDFRPDKSEPNY